MTEDWPVKSRTHQSTHFGRQPAVERARGRGGRLAPGLEPQLAHGAHDLRRAGVGAPDDDAFADNAGPKESHQDRNGRQALSSDFRNRQLGAAAWNLHGEGESKPASKSQQVCYQLFRGKAV
jgi:hypothetical protein